MFSRLKQNIWRVNENLYAKYYNLTIINRMKMTGKGLKRVSGYGYGDHYINIKIKPPKVLDEKQRALMRVR